MIVSFIGRLSAEKGFIQYIDAVNLFKRKYDKASVVFHVLGDGPLEGLLRDNTSLIEYLGVMDNRSMIGYLSTIDVGVALTLSTEVRWIRGLKWLARVDGKRQTNCMLGQACFYSSS